MIVGEVYEIDPYIKICFTGMNTSSQWPYYARLIGFNSINEPVFERDGRYFAMTKKNAKITHLKREQS